MGFSIFATALVLCVLFYFMTKAAEAKPVSPPGFIQFFKVAFGLSFIGLFVGVIWMIWS